MISLNLTVIRPWAILCFALGMADAFAGESGSLSLKSQESGTEARLVAVSAVSSQVAWVGGSKGTYLRTLNGGETWQAGSVPEGENLVFADLHAFSAEHALLLSAGKGERARIYRTTDGGQHWEIVFQNRNPDLFFDCIDFNGLKGALIGDAKSGVFPLYLSADGGGTWALDESAGLKSLTGHEGEAPPALSGTCVRVMDDNSVTFVTAQSGRVIQVWPEKSTATDTPIDHGTETSGLASLAFLDDHEGMAAGGELLNKESETANAIITRDGGKSWTKAKRPPFSGPIYAVNFIPETRRAIVVGPNGSAWTEDLGQTWVQFDKSNHWSVGFAPDGTGWMVGPEGRITRVTYSPDSASASNPRPGSDRRQFTIGTAKAQAGSRGFGAIEVAPGSDSGLDIPVAVIQGVLPGPIAVFIAGSHGTEYSTIIAMQKLIGVIDPELVSGTVIILPLLNVPSFTGFEPRINPVDGKPMGFGYPGDPQGTQSQRAAHEITRQVLSRADFLIDLHGGDLDEDLMAPYTAVLRGGNPNQDAASVALARAYGLKHIVLFDRDVKAPRTALSLSGHALTLGKPVILVAAGRGGIVADSDVEAILSGALGVLASRRMLDRPELTVTDPVWLDGNGPHILAEQDGVFYATATGGSMIKQGQLLGYTTDFLGRKTSDIISPVDGVLAYIRGVPSMWESATLANVLPILPSLPAWQPPQPQ